MFNCFYMIEFSSIYTPTHLTLPSLRRICTQVINRVSTQRTRILTTRLEPLIQTRAVEQVLARRAPLIRHALVRGDDTIADGALALALQRADNVALEDLQSVDDVSVGEGNHALGGHDPGLPLLLADGDAVEACHGDAFDGVAGGDADDDGGLVLVDFVAGGDFTGGASDADDEFLFVSGWGLLVVGPGLDFVEGVGDDERGEELGCPGFDGDAGLLGAAVDVPCAEEAGDVFEGEVEEVDEEPLHVLLLGF